VIGHFGSCGPLIADQLAVAIPALLQRAPDASMMLLGDGCAALRRRLVEAFPGLAGRLWETGPLAARDISAHLLACDIMLQPYAEGVTTRRTSVMAALVHGVATVTTSGRLTEPLWQETGAVALARAGDPSALAAIASRLLGDPETRARIGTTGRSVYDACFDVRHTVAALRSRVCPDAVSVGR
jgi:glycosyltransferase involved in cell wall biosynthesis